MFGVIVDLTFKLHKDDVISQLYCNYPAFTGSLFLWSVCLTISILIITALNAALLSDSYLVY